MAEGALFHLAGKVLELLGSFTLPEVKLAFGVQTEIEKLTSTVSTIQAVILDAEKQSSHNHQIKDWLRKLKDVLHDADDFLDDFSTQVLRHKVMRKKKVRIFSSSSNRIAFSPKMGRQIKAIRERLNAIAKDKEDFHFIQSFIEPQVMSRDRETYSFVLEDEVVGRENDKEVIIELLFDDNVVENISIIPIVGIGGLGKTSLAQLVYNDQSVNKNFELKLWVCISEIFDVKRIVKEILEQLTDERLKESFEMLQNQLREKLSGKKYLLVLDDMWNEDNTKWLLLKNLLMVGARGSRIVVTTRSEMVASITGATSWYALRGLPVEKAWNLFEKVAFGEGQLPKNQAFISLGKEILEKCVGVPLAIRTIASLLRSKTSENEWRSFKNYELSKITQGEENNILSTLKLSYDHLPSYLKQCFAYCKLFPKDYKIHVGTLIDLWAAQGFIKLSNPKQRVKDVGREYFRLLLWRSFFQDVEKDYWGNIWCKMHDLMHDLAISVAGTECTVLHSTEENIGENVRHVSFNLLDSSTQFPIIKFEGKRIRTVLGHRGGCDFTCNALISNLKYSRTLDLSNLWLKKMPSSIGKLKHLRYLDVSENRYIKILPNSIVMLLNLQTLNLKNCSALRELPQDTKNLVNLRHLDISGCYKLTHMPYGLGNLTSLEILPYFVVRDEGVKARASGGLSELNKLSNLGGNLWIMNLGHGKDDMMECKAANMKEKQHLHQLDLWWNSELVGETECYDEMSLEGLQPHPNLNVLKLSSYMGVTIPSWVSSLTNLVDLQLWCNCRCHHLPPLNQLPFLNSVRLRNMEALQYISEDIVSNVLGYSITTFFPSLFSLEIEKCPNLKGWWRKDDNDGPGHLLLPSFPRLSKLEIEDCPNLTFMPLFPYLVKLKLWEASSKVLQQTMNTQRPSTSTTSSYYFPLSELEFLDLKGVNDLESLPTKWLQNLVSLRRLFIYECHGLMSLPCRGIQYLTSLQEMKIVDCNELALVNDEDDGMQWQGLRSLHSLCFWGTPKLVSLPDGLQHVTTLQKLEILNCNDLMAIPEWIGNLTSLHHLSISGCSNQTSLPEEICNISSLQIFKIKNCPNLMALPESIDNLTLLRVLTIGQWPNLTSLSQEICNLTSLECLTIESCPNLMALPESMGNLTSLRGLVIDKCHNLTSLPQGIRDLTSLELLKIIDCPILLQRCQRQIGEDWPKIAHVLNVKLHYSKQ
ncbi:putative disease resistance protein RGA3 [Quercus suber]|uniref:putative disease resistance protein RGA3 n=1 Tax=Quercus suber TaxID=58331 RepID=UPI0032DFED1F